MRFRKKKRSYKKLGVFIVAIFLVSIMLASVLNYSLTFRPSGNVNNPDDLSRFDSRDYNGREFFSTPQGWVTNVNGNQIILSYAPWELENFTSDINVNFLLLSNKVYITANPNHSIQGAANEFFRYLRFNSVVQACPEDVEGCEQLPLRDCDDSTDDVGIVYFREEEEFFMEFRNNCLFMQGNSVDLVKGVDRLVWNYLGVK